MKTRSPRKTEPWLSPREAAELLLDHKSFPRTTLQIRNLQKQICTACAEHNGITLDDDWQTEEAIDGRR